MLFSIFSLIFKKIYELRVNTEVWDDFQKKFGLIILKYFYFFKYNTKNSSFKNIDLISNWQKNSLKKIPFNKMSIKSFTIVNIFINVSFSPFVISKDIFEITNYKSDAIDF